MKFLNRSGPYSGEARGHERAEIGSVVIGRGIAVIPLSDNQAMLFAVWRLSFDQFKVRNDIAVVAIDFCAGDMKSRDVDLWQKRTDVSFRPYLCLWIIKVPRHLIPIRNVLAIKQLIVACGIGFQHQRPGQQLCLVIRIKGWADMQVVVADVIDQLRGDRTLTVHGVNTKTR